MVRRKEKSELEQAEIKLENLIERRNALNSQASVFREERDLLHGQKKDVVDQVRALRDERDRLVGEMRVHRDQRNEFQRKARDLIELKRKVRGQLHGSIAGELERLRRDVKGMEMRQQTSSLKLEEENALRLEWKRFHMDRDRWRERLANLPLLDRRAGDMSPSDFATLANGIARAKG